MSEPAKGTGQRCIGSMSLCDEEDASFFHLFLGLLLELRLLVHLLPHPCNLKGQRLEDPVLC